MLDIYLTQDPIQTARGQLYLDDGETFTHATHKEYTLVEFSYQDGDLFIRTPHSNYKAGQSFVIDEITLLGSRCGPFADAIELLSQGAISVAPLLTATYPLEAATHAFEHAVRKDALKVLFDVR